MTRPRKRIKRRAFAPVPACLAGIVQAVQSRYGVTLATEFCKCPM